MFQREIGPTLAVALCDRHFGVGADGLIEIAPAENADFSFRLYNADGSPAEISGNGLRCAGRFLYEKGHQQSSSLSIEAGGQVRQVHLLIDDGAVTGVRAEMGPAQDLGEIQLQGKTWRRILTGNPHAVTFVDDIADAPVAETGPLIENDPVFPDRTNVEFVQVSDDELQVRFWERGVGVTLASGSGSCAALAASGLSRATVRTLGGDLLVEKDDQGRISMTGPAVHVFDAKISESWLMEMRHAIRPSMLEDAAL